MIAARKNGAPVEEKPLAFSADSIPPENVEEQYEPLITEEEKPPPKTPKPSRSRANSQSTPKEEPIRASHKMLAEELAILTGASCGAIGFLTKHEFWALDDREAKELGAALADAIPSLPAKQADAIAKRIPVLRLAITAGTIIGGRVWMEYDIRKQELQLRQQQNQIELERLRRGEPPNSYTNGKTAVEYVTPQKTAPFFDIPGLSNQ